MFDNAQLHTEYLLIPTLPLQCKKASYNQLHFTYYLLIMNAHLWAYRAGDKLIFYTYIFSLFLNHELSTQIIILSLFSPVWNLPTTASVTTKIYMNQ